MRLSRREVEARRKRSRCRSLFVARVSDHELSVCFLIASLPLAFKLAHGAAGGKECRRFILTFRGMMPMYTSILADWLGRFAARRARFRHLSKNRKRLRRQASAWRATTRIAWT